MKENRNTKSYPLTTAREKSRFLKVTLSFNNSHFKALKKKKNLRQISQYKFETKAQARKHQLPIAM